MPVDLSLPAAELDYELILSPPPKRPKSAAAAAAAAQADDDDDAGPIGTCMPSLVLAPIKAESLMCCFRCLQYHRPTLFLSSGLVMLVSHQAQLFDLRQDGCRGHATDPSPSVAGTHVLYANDDHFRETIDISNEREHSLCFGVTFMSIIVGPPPAGSTGKPRVSVKEAAKSGNTLMAAATAMQVPSLSYVVGFQLLVL